MNIQETTFCPHCKNHVSAQNFILHEAQCEKMKKNRVIIEQVYPPKEDSKVLDSSFQRMESNNRLNSKPMPESRIEEYRCPNCNKKLGLEEIETHQNICEERPIECKFCKECFPQSLMQFHRMECNPNDNHQYDERENNDHDEEEEEIPNNQVNNRSIMQRQELGEQVPEAEEVKEVIQQDGSYQRTEIRRLPGGGFQYMSVISNGNNPQGFISSTSFMGNNMNSNVNVNYGGVPRNNNNNPNPALYNMHFPSMNMNSFGDRMVPREMNNNSNMFSQSNNNPGMDEFDRIEQSYGLSRVFPRGFALRQIMNNSVNFNELPFFLSHLQGNANQGLSKEERESFENYSFTKRTGLSNDDLKCVICYSDFAEKEQIRCLPCFHKFHVECIDTWLKKNSKCPVCKYDLLKSFGREAEGEEEFE